jgi:hypothetical protein
VAWIKVARYRWNQRPLGAREKFDPQNLAFGRFTASRCGPSSPAAPCGLDLSAPTRVCSQIGLEVLLRKCAFVNRSCCEIPQLFLRIWDRSHSHSNFCKHYLRSFDEHFVAEVCDFECGRVVVGENFWVLEHVSPVFALCR